MSHTGTMRGTPKNRPKSQNMTTHFAESPTPSSIPRPALEHHISQSDAGTSTLSASRAKQTKRDEVRAATLTDTNRTPANNGRQFAARSTRI